MIEKEYSGIEILNYQEDQTRGVILEKIRTWAGDSSSLAYREALIKERWFSRDLVYKEKTGNLSSSSISYPLIEDVLVEAELFFPRQGGENPLSFGEFLNISIDCPTREHYGEHFGEAWYNKTGFLLGAEAYPLTSSSLSMQEFEREIKEEGLEFGSEEASDRIMDLLSLADALPLCILPQGEKKLSLKGVLDPILNKIEEIGIFDSGDFVFWNENYYRVTCEGEKLIVETYSGTKEKTLLKRMVFPLKIKEFEEMARLFTEEGIDWWELPKFLPIELYLPAQDPDNPSY